MFLHHINHVLFWFLIHIFSSISAKSYIFSQPSSSAPSLIFPKGFRFGVATAAYQVEGGWNVFGKGESIWDRFTHQNPGRIKDHSSGDVADDSYHLYKDDVNLLNELGVHFYRFSIAWTRLLPNGFNNKVNDDGLRYYNDLIDTLIHNNITPVVTMYHWDLPQSIQDLGGWTAPLVIDLFEDYADTLFKSFGDRVKMWITFNEPLEVCLSGYALGIKAPGISIPGIAEYMCAHNILKAHGRVYRLYKKQYYTQEGALSISLSTNWEQPATNIKEDIIAAERALQFYLGWFANPIFSDQGDYPKVMRERIDMKSSEQNFAYSRLPSFTVKERDMIRYSADFFALNHYTSRLAKSSSKVSITPSFHDDMGVDEFLDANWPSTNSSWLKVTPWGFRKILNWIRLTYNDPLIIVTENGVSEKPGLNDQKRILYMRSYLKELLNAIHVDKCSVIAYTHWSLMDNFEWDSGYTERFGLYEVDDTSPSRTRIPRKSAEFYKNIISTRTIPSDDFEGVW